MRRLLTVLLLASAAVGISLPARAHNVLISSDPKDGAALSAAPAVVTLVFDQAVRQGYAQVGVTGPDGAAMADGAASVAAEKVTVKVKPLTAAGAYVVGYRILSADGHPVTGKITFRLTAPGSAAPETAPATAAETAPQTASASASDAADSARAAEAAANGGAGMAVVWIVAALLLLAAGTGVALRRARPADAIIGASHEDASDGEGRA
ncbi:copper resistance CopC family protein [Nonomuraea roseoviolacea]|uniref:Methionine-rich copper-binding protein CopC n=1 Tax=Nonomuraea roseoviolacea subsp. carminata TaxID=160689 RepID=A0ABT1K882_9ACTN|nr:copper resistance CopC family protein [Nonomuraea roseoviolacea]MCP2349807.1 methionine-rich copper-binding protein CopC [Nonomuraea roseoviolacea subsp. carminata]